MMKLFKASLATQILRSSSGNAIVIVIALFAVLTTTVTLMMNKESLSQQTLQSRRLSSARAKIAKILKKDGAIATSLRNSIHQSGNMDIKYCVGGGGHGCNGGKVHNLTLYSPVYALPPVAVAGTEDAPVQYTILGELCKTGQCPLEVISRFIPYCPGAGAAEVYCPQAETIHLMFEIRKTEGNLTAGQITKLQETVDVRTADVIPPTTAPMPSPNPLDDEDIVYPTPSPIYIYSPLPGSTPSPGPSPTASPTPSPTV